MLKRFITVVLIFSALLTAEAQQLELMFAAGFASSSMYDLKDLNSQVKNNLPFQTDVVSNFPVTPQYGGIVAVHFGNVYKLGMLYAFNSTGSRLAAADYSGSYRFDDIVTSHSIGLMNGFTVFDKKGFGLDLEITLGEVFTTVKISEDFNMGDISESTSEKFTSRGFFIEPRIEANYQWKLLKAGVYLGCYFNPGAKLANSSAQKASTTTNWSGIRFGLLIGIQTGKKKKPTSSKRLDESTAMMNIQPSP
ncbi:MAG: hypothetical protein WCO02_12610 [Bacteroidota bacterium]